MTAQYCGLVVKINNPDDFQKREVVGVVHNPEDHTKMRLC